MVALDDAVAEEDLGPDGDDLGRIDPEAVVPDSSRHNAAPGPLNAHGL
jgi:hypothetical protein